MNNSVQQPLVSVVCDVFNHAPFLRDCLEGFVSQQTSFSYEVLIHDDASRDESQTIIKEYQAKYPQIIKPILQTTNLYSQGVSIWDRHQFSRVQGKYVALCEGDDYWTDPLKLQKQVDFLEAHPDFSMCFHNGKMIWQNGEKADKLYANLTDGIYTAEHLYRRHLVVTASIVVRAEVVQDSCFLEALRHRKIKYADLFLILSSTAQGKVWGMSDVMSVYRRHDGGVVFKQSLTNDIVDVRLSYFFLDYFDDPKLLDMIRKMCFWNSFKDYLYSSIHGYTEEKAVFKEAIQRCFRWRYAPKVPFLVYKVLTHWNKYKKVAS